MYAFLILVASFSSLAHLFISSLVLLPMYLCSSLLVYLQSLNSPLLLFSLLIYFFQYVKELGPISIAADIALYPIPFGKRRAWWRITDSNR